MDWVERAPITLRLIPAIIAIALIAYASRAPGTIVILIVSIAFLATVISLYKANAVNITARIRFPTGSRLGSRHKDEDRRENPKVFQIIYEDPIVGSKIEEFLLSRSTSRPSNRYAILHEFVSGSKTTYLIINGQDQDIESEIIESAIISFLEGVSIRPVKPPSFGGLISSSSNKIGQDKDQVFIGYRLDTPRLEPVYLYYRDFEGHIGIFGSTGSGKSTTLRVLASRLLDQYKAGVLVFDWTGEHRVLASRGFKIVDVSTGELPADILSCNSEDRKDYAFEVLTRALDLTEPQAYLLSRVLSNARNLRELYDMVLELPEDSRWDREVKRALQRKLGMLVLNEGRRIFRDCPGDLARGNVSGIVLDLSNIMSLHVRRLYVVMMLSILFTEAYRRYSSQGENHPLMFVFIDEVQNISMASDILAVILSEARKYGVHIIYATQSPSIMDSRLLLNTNTKIVHSLKSNKDKKLILETMGMDVDWFSRLDKLPTGTAILQSISQPQPILVEIHADAPFSH
ncbi:MAG: ATP-binding protein [Desulfurococcales archaeon]|nr:ATP-binding protein [Desulfurococcales archaeon]